MDRHRSDLVLGVVGAVLLHGLVLGAAAHGLLQREPRPVPIAQAPLEVQLLEQSAWRAQLEDTSAARSPELREASDAHASTSLPAWPELPGPRQLQVARSIRVRAPLPDLRTPDSAMTRRGERLAAQALVPREERRVPEDAPAETTLSREPTAQRTPLTLEAGSALVLYRPELRYPSRPHRRGIEGTVRVGLEVDGQGQVVRAWVIRGAGNRELDRCALRHLRAWRFDAPAIAKLGRGRSFQSDVRFKIE